jgi:hypothetical protein
MSTFQCYAELVEEKHHPVLSALAEIRNDLEKAEDEKWNTDLAQTYLLGAISLLTFLSRRQRVPCVIPMIKVRQIPMFCLMGAETTSSALSDDIFDMLHVHARAMCLQTARFWGDYFVYAMKEMMDIKAKKPEKALELARQLDQAVYLYAVMEAYFPPSPKKTEMFNGWKKACLVYRQALQLVHSFIFWPVGYLTKQEPATLMQLCRYAHEAYAAVKECFRRLKLCPVSIELVHLSGVVKLGGIHALLSYQYYLRIGSHKNACLALERIQLGDLPLQLVESFNSKKFEKEEEMKLAGQFKEPNEELSGDADVFWPLDKKRKFMKESDMSRYQVAQVTLYEFT